MVSALFCLWVPLGRFFVSRPRLKTAAVVTTAVVTTVAVVVVHDRTATLNPLNWTVQVLGRARGIRQGRTRRSDH